MKGALIAIFLMLLGCISALYGFYLTWFGTGAGYFLLFSLACLIYPYCRAMG